MALPTYSYKTMIINILLFYPTLILGGYLLFGKSIAIFIVYLSTLILTITIGRYVICRACHYYGKPCPSFGFSYLAKIFPKDIESSFNGRSALIETWIIGVCLMLPLLSVILSWFQVIGAYSLIEYIMMGIYITLVFSMSLVHKITGCDICEIEDCPLSRV